MVLANSPSPSNPGGSTGPRTWQRCSSKHSAPVCLHRTHPHRGRTCATHSECHPHLRLRNARRTGTSGQATGDPEIADSEPCCDQPRWGHVSLQECRTNFIFVDSAACAPMPSVIAHCQHAHCSLRLSAVSLSHQNKIDLVSNLLQGIRWQSAKIAERCEGVNGRYFD